MSDINNEEYEEPYFVKFYLHPDEEGGFNIEMHSGLPTEGEIAMTFMGMLSQINMGDCSSLMLESIRLESLITKNQLFQEITHNWQRELEERQALAKESPHSIVSPLRVFGASNL